MKKKVNKYIPFISVGYIEKFFFARLNNTKKLKKIEDIEIKLTLTKWWGMCVLKSMKKSLSKPPIIVENATISRSRLAKLILFIFIFPE